MGGGPMGDKITRPAKSADLLRAKLLKEALQRGMPVLSCPAEASPPIEELASSFVPDSVEVQKAYLEQLVECAPEAISILDTQLHITRVNGEFQKMFGFTSEEALSRRIDSLIVP